MNEKMNKNFEEKGHGYATYTEPQCVGVMTKTQAEKVAEKISGEEYTLLTVNSCTDSRKATPDPRIYTFQLTSIVVKQNARRIAKAKNK